MKCKGEKSLHACKICSKICKTPWKLKRHTRIHEREKFICGCGSQYKKDKKYKAHVQICEIIDAEYEAGNIIHSEPEDSLPTMVPMGPYHDYYDENNNQNSPGTNYLSADNDEDMRD